MSEISRTFVSHFRTNIINTLKLYIMKSFNITDKNRIAKTYLFCYDNFICFHSPTPRVIRRKDDFIFKSQCIPILIVSDTKLFDFEPSFYTSGEHKRKYCYTPSDLLDIYCDNYKDILDFYVDKVSPSLINETIEQLFPY